MRTPLPKWSRLVLCRRNVASLGVCIVFCLFIFMQYRIVQNDFPGPIERKPEKIIIFGSMPLHRSVADVEQERRRINVLETCRRYKNSRWLDIWPRMKALPFFDKTRSPLISSKTKILLCTAAKVGSTYFTRWIKAINAPGPMLSPLEIPISQAKRGDTESLNSLKSYTSKLNFVNSATKVVFGRDPFSRVFAAYIDKLFSPNPTYWRDWGQRALRAARSPILQCGSQATFKQFINFFFLHLPPLKDMHLLPISHECRLCEMHYNFIGKLETVDSDVEYISNLINVSSQFQMKEKHKTALLYDGMMDTVNSVFSWKNDIEKCMPLDEMGKRIWRKFQIRGIIDHSFDYPIKPGQIDVMSRETFIQICKDAISKSTDRVKLRKQKRIALEEAYLSLSPQLIKQMLTFYKLDMEVFGYTQNLEFLKDEEYRSQFNKTDVFNWRSSWNIS